MKYFRDVRTRVIPHSDRGSLRASRCCQGKSLAGINSVFPRGAETRTSPEPSRVRPRSPPSRIPDEPGSSSCQDRSFIFLPHQRLLARSAAVESGGCFLLFRSEFALWSAGNQTPGSNACLCLALLPPTRKGVFACAATDLSAGSPRESCTACCGNHEQRVFLLE